MKKITEEFFRALGISIVIFIPLYLIKKFTLIPIPDIAIGMIAGYITFKINDFYGTNK